MLYLSKTKGTTLEEHFEQVLQQTTDPDILSVESACDRVGLNYLKILEHATTDRDMSSYLNLACACVRGNILEKFYAGDLCKNEADLLVGEVQDIIEVYVNSLKDTEGV